MICDMHNTNTNLKVPFGFKDGRLHAPNNTARGLACECFCPGCRSQLIANQGKRKRPYFSHYDSVECSGGYETAIHLMAKQIIEDRKKLSLPEFQLTLEKTLPTGEVLQEEVQVSKATIFFNQVKQEHLVEGLRPDALGITNDGIEVCIEIFVTHAVSDDKRKRFAHRNMIEIDLSRLPYELATDETQLTKEVLWDANREWISCQLYKSEIAAARKRLRAKVRKIIAEIRNDIEKAKAQQGSQTRTSINSTNETMLDAIRHTHRKKYAKQLKNLHDPLCSSKFRNPLIEQQAAEKVADYIGYDTLPTFLNESFHNDWIIETQRPNWQGFLYQEFIIGNRGKTLRAKQIKQLIVKHYGLVKWVEELIDLKKEHKKMGKEKGLWDGKTGAWFLTDEENRMIPCPYLLVCEYLYRLVSIGLLTVTNSNHNEFMVKYDCLELMEKEERVTVRSSLSYHT